MAPMRSEPRLVVNRFWAISTTSSSSFREYGYAWVEVGSGGRTCLGAACSCAGRAVDDEVAGQVAFRHIRNRIRTRIIVAVPVSAPTAYVEDPEADDRQDDVARASERAEWDHEHIDDPGIVERVARV